MKVFINWRVSFLWVKFSATKIRKISYSNFYRFTTLDLVTLDFMTLWLCLFAPLKRST
jgi:hypothetical protein